MQFKIYHVHALCPPTTDYAYSERIKQVTCNNVFCFFFYHIIRTYNNFASECISVIAIQIICPGIRMTSDQIMTENRNNASN